MLEFLSNNGVWVLCIGGTETDGSERPSTRNLATLGDEIS